MNDNEKGSMDEIELDLTPMPTEPAQRTLPQNEPLALDPFAQATEDSLSGIPDDEPADDMWEDFFKPNPHVTMAQSPIKRVTLPESVSAFHAMKVGIAEANELLKQGGLENITEEQAKKLSPQEIRLVNIIRNLSPIWQEHYYDNAFKSGDWQQTVQHNETDLGIRRVKMDRVNDPILVIRSSLGQGALVQIPLWNTGIWVTMRAPSNNDLLNLDQRVRMEKASLGRFSNGMVFSNVEVYTVAAYARFALEHVYSTTYEFDTVETVDELLSTIKSTDYQQLLYGLLSAMYPDGYPFRQPCVANPNTCDHIDESILSIARLSWTDRSRLTAKQKRMMASRNSKMNRAQLAEYQAEFPFDNRAMKLNASLTAFLAVPTLQDQIEAGYRWVDGIAESTNVAFGMKLSEVDRYRHIVRSGMMTSLRQYSHWIERLEIKEKDGVDPTVITDSMKKDEALEVISGDPVAIKILDTGIMKWICSCSVTVIGLDKSPCPACQSDVSEELSTHPELIPLDVGYIFFTLVASKIRQIEEGAAGR